MLSLTLKATWVNSHEGKTNTPISSLFIRSNLPGLKRDRVQTSARRTPEPQDHRAVTSQLSSNVS